MLPKAELSLYDLQAPQQQEAQPPQNSLNQSLNEPVEAFKVPGNKSPIRLLTEESIDSSVTQNERLHLKLVHYIKKQKQCPPTTIDFYKIGKVLGKGAFGKVNLAM